MVHRLAHVWHVCLHALRDRLLAEVEHRVHLFVWFVHLERVFVEVRRELIQCDPLQRCLMLALHPLLLLLFDELLCFKDSCSHIFLAAESSVSQLDVLLLQAAYKTAQSVQFLHHLVLLRRCKLYVALVVELLPILGIVLLLLIYLLLLCVLDRLFE